MRKLLFSVLLLVFFTGLTQAEVLVQKTLSQEKKAFHIRKQPISSALADFGLQSGLIIALGEHIQNTSGAVTETNIVRGRMRPEKALRKLLKNTNYRYEILENQSIRVFRVAEPAPANKQEDPSQTLEEIVITAQKRAQPPLEVPIATSVFTSDQLNKNNISSISDIASQTPGLISTQFSYANPTFNIRGAQNTFSSAGSSEPTGVFLDEIYISRFSASDFRLFDLNQAVVARGPQGTLFGRNVTSGAILLFTKPPDPDKKVAKLNLTLGNNQFKEVKTTINLPVSETTAVKFSGVYGIRDGIGNDLISNREQDNLDSRSVRLQLLSKPTTTSRFIFSADNSYENNNGRTLTTSRLGDIGIRESLLGIPQQFEREISGLSLKADIPMGGGRLTSISGYRTAQSDETFSRSDLSFSLLDSGFQETSREFEEPETISQEFRYLSKHHQNYDFTAGLYLFFENSDRLTEQTQLAAITGIPEPRQIIDQSVSTQSYAIYFDSTFSMTPTTDLTVGARYTFEKKKAEIRFDREQDPINSFAESADEAWQKLTPRVVYSWQPNPDRMIYASYTQGFTAGGFNTEASTVEDFSAPFNPEKSDAIELGANTKWLEGTLSADIVAFRQRYKDKQEFTRPDIFSPNTILNASRATADGLEFEASWKINDRFRVATSYAYLDGKYGHFNVPGETSRTGNRLPGAPKSQYSFSLDAKKPLSKGELSGIISWSWQDTYTPGSTNSRFFPSYGILDTRITYRLRDKGIGITWWANNLLNKEYQLATTGFSNSDGAWYAPPRFFGLTLDVSMTGNR